MVFAIHIFLQVAARHTPGPTRGRPRGQRPFPALPADTECLPTFKGAPTLPETQLHVSRWAAAVRLPSLRADPTTPQELPLTALGGRVGGSARRAGPPTAPPAGQPVGQPLPRWPFTQLRKDQSVPTWGFTPGGRATGPPDPRYTLHPEEETANRTCVTITIHSSA